MKLDEANLAAMLRPRGSAGDPGASPQDAASPLAWRREMERAQADAWFHEALRTPPHHGNQAKPQAGESASHHNPVGSERSAPRHRFAATAPAKAGAVGTVAQAVKLWPTLAANTSAALTLTPAAAGVFKAAAEPGSAAPAVEPPAPAPAMDRALSTLLGRSIENPVAPDAGAAAVAEATAPEAQSRDAGGMSRPSGSTRLPVRVHIEGNTQQATVWLGVDAAARAELPAVTEAIGRWLAQAGYGVPTFVCNGRVIDGPGRESLAAEDRAAGPVPPIEAFVIEPPTGESA